MPCGCDGDRDGRCWSRFAFAPHSCGAALCSAPPVPSRWSPEAKKSTFLLPAAACASGEARQDCPSPGQVSPDSRSPLPARLRRSRLREVQPATNYKYQGIWSAGSQGSVSQVLPCRRLVLAAALPGTVVRRPAPRRADPPRAPPGLVLCLWDRFMGLNSSPEFPPTSS